MCQEYDPQVLFDAVVAALEERDWKFGQAKDRPVLFAASRGQHGIYPCLFQVMPDRPWVVFYAHVQCRVPEVKRAAMAELLTRANYGLGLGNFELDFSDGEVRFKTSMDVADGQLTTGMVMSLVGASLSMVDRYLPAIMSVLWNDVAPEDAIGMVEDAE